MAPAGEDAPQELAAEDRHYATDLCCALGCAVGNREGIERLRHIRKLGLAGLGCSALLPLTISFGQEEMAALLHRVDPRHGLSDADYNTIARWLNTGSSLESKPAT